MEPMALLLGDGALESEYQKLVSTCNILPMLDAGICLANTDSTSRSDFVSPLTGTSAPSGMFQP